MIDGCDGRLKLYKPDEYDLIIVHFVFEGALRSITNRGQCSDGTIRKRLLNALGFVEGIASL